MQLVVISAIILVVTLVQAIPHQAENSRIYGGEEAEPHSIPYVVYLNTIIQDDENESITTITDGVLITPSAVLTSADSFESDFLRVEILFGAHRIFPTPDSDILRILNPTDVIVHPNFTTNDYLVNNLAICRLQDPVQLNNIVNVVPLPFNPDNDYVGDLATVSGWGGDENKLIISDFLRKMEVEVISNDECESPSDSVLCTSGESGKSVCTIDKGGPMVSSAGELIGIVIGTYLCGVPSQFGPSYYTRITSHLRWIVQNV